MTARSTFGALLLAAGMTALLTLAAPAAAAVPSEAAGLIATMDGGSFDVILEPGQPESRMLELQNSSGSPMEVHLTATLNETASTSHQMERILLHAAPTDTCSDHAIDPDRMLVLAAYDRVHQTALPAGETSRMCVSVMLADDGSRVGSLTVVDLRFDAFNQPDGSLAPTGYQSSPLGVIAAATALMGLLLLLSAWRRRRAHATAEARTDPSHD